MKTTANEEIQMATFFSYTERDKDLVHRVKRLTLTTLPRVVALWEDGLSHDDFLEQIHKEIPASENLVFFVGETLGRYQVNDELATFWRLKMEAIADVSRRVVFVCLCARDREDSLFRNELAAYGGCPRLRSPRVADDDANALGIAKDLARALHVPWRYVDGLPADPHLFNYEKDIIQHYQDTLRYFPSGVAGERESPKDLPENARLFAEQSADDVHEKWLLGCPERWPNVEMCGEATHDNQLREEVIGKRRPPDACVFVKALTTRESSEPPGLTFPEAGPRDRLYFAPDSTLRVAIMVSGGIAPGVNAVIDGIVQRHWLYTKDSKGGAVHIYGLQDGFLSGGRRERSVRLVAERPQSIPIHLNNTVVATPDHAHEGGSILGTSRVGELLHSADRVARLEKVDGRLLDANIDILYVIGGDGTMKAAHALHEIARQNPLRKNRKLSVVAIPKTMDNDILWVWQSFGFLSAVEKAREVIEHLSTEVHSNPRLCVVQLFGSDSGFVVSHAVLASATGHCVAALIPEVKFSMQGLVQHLRKTIHPDENRPPHGIIVMAETAIPTDAQEYINDPDIGLTPLEAKELQRFIELRERNQRIQGQTEDALRSAGLKIVSQGLLKGLRQTARPNEPEWELLRVVTNEPRHLLRAIPPSCMDIILGQRLGTLAVDNAMAGYTDFMISQWLTEYVLVPLKLVVLGRKRIPDTGIFWKSVLAKTRQPANLVDVHSAAHA